MHFRFSATAPGFTLIELLVVMTIIGMGLFVLIPRLDFTRSEDMSGGERLSSLAAEARREAMSTNERQYLEFVVGGAFVRWKDREIELEGAVARARINEEEPPGLERKIRLFTDGHMDQCRVELSSGKTLRCEVLSGMFSYD